MASISSRGRELQNYFPVFFDVLDDAWDPDSNPEGFVNLGLAENTLMQAEMKEYINTHIDYDARKMNYGDGFYGSKEIRAAACHSMNKTFSPHTPLNSSHLIATAGVGNALETCAWALCDRDDYILVGRPYWGSFNFVLTSRPGVKVREVTFDSIDPFSLEAVSRYEQEVERARAEGRKVSALLLCTPHNPTGRCYSSDVLKAYLTMCQRLGIHFISDEIYALSTWDNPQALDQHGFISILSLDVAQYIDPNRVHVLWGSSKDFGVAGIRIGFLISQHNPDFLRSANSISFFNCPSSPADHVVSKLLADDAFMEWYKSEYRIRLASSYQFATKFMDAHGIKYMPVNTGLFLMINLGDTVFKGLEDQDIYQRLRAKKVYILPGTSFKYERSGWFRAVIAHPITTLQEGFQRLVRAIPQSSQGLPVEQLENLSVDKK
ncbi:hypothetical protein CKM354_001038400 [Cercospora kikuchii]|uniref:Aminotransferase class I/classII large domain-containing protein n=1 Tax=Cercospora kikuchii TaxID=84275 RepID=A0A9P3CMK8_9PEZI|nr:uncharacterized protein CKM354_001038400 [Cercospora kikuchii]GIZ47289.1 hypothetical protein CKM354_001038400 [Cercospora kikuchii]